MGFDPVTLGILGTGVSVIGSLVKGMSASDAMNYQAQVAQNNATIARQNAAYSIQAGQAQAEKSSLRGAANLASIRATQAAGGVDVNSGSAVEVQASQRQVNKLDTDTTMNNAQLQAYGYRSQETGYEAQAKLDRSSAGNAIIGAGFEAGGTLLGNASSLSFKWGDKTGGGNESFGGENPASQGGYGGLY